MIYFLIYFIYLIFAIFLPIGILIYLMLGLFYARFGAPFVPTKGSALEKVFKKIKISPGMKFYDLGSGDGKVILKACDKYGVMGVGFELNPFLITYAKIMAVIKGCKSARFKRVNLFAADLKEADIIYMFLMPKTLVRLEPKLKKECKNGCIIISHGFEIKGFKRYEIGSVEERPFSTYLYRR